MDVFVVGVVVACNSVLTERQTLTQKLRSFEPMTSDRYIWGLDPTELDGELCGRR